MNFLLRSLSPGQRLPAGAVRQSLPWVMISAGLLFRLIQYGANRSLWADEATLALNIVNRSFSELMQPLDYQQAAPVGFLMVEKLAIELLGNHEYALRLFPLASGIASLFLFYALAKRCLSARVLPVALGLFATLPPLIYFSSEVKQYASDVAIALLAWLIVVHLSHQKSISLGQIALYGLLGAALIWFSHPVVFVLAGTGLSTVLISWVNHQRTRIKSLLATYSLWALSFIAFYALLLAPLSSRDDLTTSFVGHGGFPASPLYIIPWLFFAVGKFFYKPLGFPIPLAVVALVAFGFGYRSLYQKNRSALLLLLSPVLATLAAAILQQYPFHQRLVLFLTPFVTVLIAEGAVQIYHKASAKGLSWLGGLFLALLFAYPVMTAGALLVEPNWREEIRPVIQYVEEHRQPGDLIYVYQRGEYQFKYYAQRYGYSPEDYIIGVDDLDSEDGYGLSEQEAQRYRADLDQLQGSRVWIIFSHIAQVADETGLVEARLNQLGDRIDGFYRPGAYALLYDLSQ